MFGPELSCSQATPSPPSRIPLSSPIGPSVTVSLALPITASPSMPATPLLSTQTRPLTLRRAVRRISSRSLRPATPVLSGKSGILALGRCFLLIIAYCSQSSLAVAFLKTDLVSVLYLRVLICSACTPPPNSLTSLAFLLHISSPPIPLLVTGLFRFSIIKRRPHSLARSPLCVIMHVAHSFVLFERPLSL
ncbi:hypothetical protein BDR03DRAFT_1015220 [Suillus americanus]|nr:hypothetical protein BDR03DRAFT_1015220 [Suillus americanus]